MRKLFLLYFLFSAYTTGYSGSKNLKLTMPVTMPAEVRELHKTTVRGTIYYPTGNVTADGTEIDTRQLKRGKIRYVALSRHLLKKYGGKFKFGDTITVKSGYSELNGEWLVKDMTHGRIKNTVDFLQPRKGGFKGVFKNVLIFKKRKGRNEGSLR